MGTAVMLSASSDALAGSREEREAQHCLELAQSLHSAYVMKDVYLKCNDDVCVPVHKFVLGSQSEYFKQQFFAKRGVDNIAANSVVNRMYAFHGTSECFTSLASFFYTAAIPEMEDPQLRAHPLAPHLQELLVMALLYPSVGPASLASYIVGKVQAATPPPTPQQAIAWIEFVHAQEAKDSGIAPALMQQLRDMAYRALATQPFDINCFLSGPAGTEDPGQPAAAAAVAEVLGAVPLQVSEVEVCEAVRTWATATYGPLGRPATGFAASDSGEDVATGDIATHEGLQAVKAKVDLRFVSNEDIFNRVKPMNLFTRRELIEVAKQRVHSGNIDTMVNTDRGIGTLERLQL